MVGLTLTVILVVLEGYFERVWDWELVTLLCNGFVLVWVVVQLGLPQWLYNVQL